MTYDKVEFENQVLSVGSEFLPAVARKVRDGEDLTTAEREEYTAWLSGQEEILLQEHAGVLEYQLGAL